MSDVLVEHHGAVAVVTFNRPASLNSMTPQFCRELIDTLRNLAVDQSTRALVLTGAGRGFSSGHALEDLDPQALPSSPRELVEHQELYAEVILSISSQPQPVVAAVNGPAAGGGLAMALAADTRVCGTSARFNAAFVRLGLSGCDVGVSYLLPKIVGPTLAFEMMLTGRLIDATEAHHHRLVLDVVPDDSVLDSALDIAGSIVANSPFGIRETKRVMWRNLDAPNLASAIELENHVQTLCATTADSAEAITAFRAKRAPTFTGR